MCGITALATGRTAAKAELQPRMSSCWPTCGATLPRLSPRRCAARSREAIARATGAEPKARIHWAMAQHRLVLAKEPKRRHSSRIHAGHVSVPMSNMRRCSDGFEIKCDSGGSHSLLRKGLLRQRDPGLASLGGRGTCGRACAPQAGQEL